MEDDGSIVAARALADGVARAMSYYPMLLRTSPPSLLDIDESFNRTLRLRVTHVAATHPDPEMP